MRPHWTTDSKQPQVQRKTLHVSGYIRLRYQCHPISAYTRQRVETHILCEQSNGGCWDMVFPTGAYCSSTQECHSNAPLVLPGSSSDHTYKPATLSHLAQVGPIRTDVAMGNRVKWVWDQVSIAVILKNASYDRICSWTPSKINTCSRSPWKAMVDTSCRWSVQGIWIQSKSRPTVTNRETNRASYPS